VEEPVPVVVPAEKKKSKKKVAAESVPEPALKKEKKPRTEAQIAATKKAGEARKAKKLELEKVKTEIAENEKELATLESTQKKSRKRKAEPQEQTPSLTSTEIVEEEITKIEKPKKQRKKKIAPPPEEPPLYLKKYIEGMLKAQNSVSEVKKNVKQIKEEADAQSKSAWGDDLKRDSVKSEVDNHMNRMYGMMFSR
jgi:colicin import membrane protein